jgi:hypothetical protein
LTGCIPLRPMIMRSHEFYAKRRSEEIEYYK